MKKGRAFELGPEHLSRLLAAGMDSHEMAQELPAEPSSCESRSSGHPPGPSRDARRRDALAELLGRPCGRLSALQGQTTEELLLDPRTDLPILRIIKEHGKELARQPAAKGSRDVAVAVYYAAIASALVFHRRKITQLPRDSLASSFDTLAGKRWMPAEIAALFGEAAKACRQPPPAGPEAGGC